MFTEQRKTLDKYIQCLFLLNLIGTVGETSLPIKLKFHQRLIVLQISFFLAHLSISPEPIGELIVYPCSGVRPSSVVVHNAQTSSSPN